MEVPQYNLNAGFLNQALPQMAQMQQIRQNALMNPLQYQMAQMQAQNMPQKLQLANLLQQLKAQTEQERARMAGSHANLYDQQTQWVAPQAQAHIGQMNAASALSSGRLNAIPQQLAMQQQRLGLLQQQYNDHKNALISPLGKLLTDYKGVVSAQGANSPAAQALAMKINATAQTMGGLNASMSPDGSVNFSTMSQAPVTNGPFPIMGAAGNQQPGLVKDPTTGTSRGSAGANFIDPATEQVKSSLTTPNVTRQQRAVIGIENVKPYLEDIANLYAPYLTYAGKASAKIGGITNQLGLTHDPGVSNQAEAESLANQSVESMISALGLNVTDQTAQMIKQSIVPKEGESPETYKARTQREIERLIEKENIARRNLRGGVPVTKPAANNFPTEFSSKAEFQQFYSKLSPEQKAEYRKMHGGN